MARLFISGDDVVGDAVTISGADAAHLRRSLRVRAGERIVCVVDGHTQHECLIDTVHGDRVRARVLRTAPASGEPRLLLHVLQAIPARGTDEAIEALAIAGAASIRPVFTARGVARGDAARYVTRVDRWRRIAREAAQLAERARPPVVAVPLPFDAALAEMDGMHVIAAMVGAAQSITAVPVACDQPLALVIGPEGGLDDSELRTLDDAGATRVSLGARVFPSRLAGSHAATLLIARCGEALR